MPGRNPLATPVAKRLERTRILEATGLTASAGVAPNKFLAHGGVWMEKAGRVDRDQPGPCRSPFLHQLPVDALWGVGPVTARKLREPRHRKAGGCPACWPAQSCRRSSAALPSSCSNFAQGARRSGGATAPRVKVGRFREHVRKDLLEVEIIRHEVAEMAADVAAWLDRKD